MITSNSADLPWQCLKTGRSVKFIFFQKLLINMKKWEFLVLVDSFPDIWIFEEIFQQNSFVEARKFLADKRWSQQFITSPPCQSRGEGRRPAPLSRRR